MISTQFSKMTRVCASYSICAKKNEYGIPLPALYAPKLKKITFRAGSQSKIPQLQFDDI